MPTLAQLQSLLDADPADTFLRYGLAMELAKQNQFDAALGQFDELLRRDPHYVPAYFMKARTFEQAGDPDRAKQTYTLGISIAQKTGDTHAAGEMTQALQALD